MALSNTCSPAIDKYSFHMENKFKKGEAVVERIRPTNKLIVTHCDGGIYYCKAQESDNRKDLVYFERELKADLFSDNK
ncbi:hypothetical protein BH09BAC3_BH09BAC3_10170 [soil metagenome]